MASHKVLIVDDDLKFLELLRLRLSREFAIEIADSGERGLAVVSENGPFAVVIADMQMPAMSGAEFLARLRNIAPSTVRIMLTASNEQEVAVEAVNQGQIARFLNKPCPTESLQSVIRQGLEQYRLTLAEKELLANTLNASISLLTEILAIVSPPAFGRATRAKRLVEQLCTRRNVKDAWEISLAAMLSQVGCMGVADSIMQRFQSQSLSGEDAEQFQAHPRLGHDLVARIPRLERVAEIIAWHQRPHHEAASVVRDSVDEDLFERAGYLKVALDYDLLVQHGRQPHQAVAQMHEQSGVYASHLLEGLADVIEAERDRRLRSIPIEDLVEGAVLAENVVDAKGTLLISKGHEVTGFLLDRLRHIRSLGRSVREPIMVLQAEHVGEENPDMSVKAPFLSVTG